MIAGLDLSLRGTGICIIGSGALHSFRVGGEIDYQNHALDLTREAIERIVVITNEILRRFRECQVTAYGIENYAFAAFASGGKRKKGSNTATVLAELGGVVKYRVLKEYHLTPVLYAPSSARRIAFGKGAGRWKKGMVGEKLEMLGMKFPSHDEADAFVVAAARYCEEKKMDSAGFWSERIWL